MLTIKRIALLCALTATLGGCAVARTAGDVAITGGQVALGAADLVI